MKLLLSIASLITAMLFTNPSIAQGDSTVTFKVSGACGMCKQRIEKSVKIKGVKQPSWDAASQSITLKYDPAVISLQSVHEKIAATGHDTELIKADDEVYSELPGCCLYRDIEVHDDAAMKINGVILQEDNKGKFSPLVGATITWLKTGKAVVSDTAGTFTIAPDEPDDQLIVSYAGYTPDTFSVNNMRDVQIILGTNNTLEAVQVTSKKRNTFINTYSPFRIQTINSGELLKAACCNLSESFETNPSVDVSYNDAVTGSKQIQLLGLSGNYTQLTVENLPGPRGLATPLGLNSIAGPWIESIQLSKGVGSVVNGYESIAGQINVELVKPETAPLLYLNGYYNSNSRADFNANLAVPLNRRWSMGLLLHDDFQYNKTDFNKDGFRDMPTGNLFSAVNRWSYDDGLGLTFQFGAKYMKDEKTGGENEFERKDKFSTSHYGVGINTERMEGFGKIGYVFPKTKYQSIGLQISAFNHEQDAFFGMKEYKGMQDNFYANLIYQSIIGNTNHKFRTGLSLNADRYDEAYMTNRYQRNETVAGGYFEYTWSPFEKFNLVAGMRADHNNLFGWFGTPRLNIRYEPITGTTIRATAGRGQRTANILAENMGNLISSRILSIEGAGHNKGFGLNPEVAWNKGISVDQKLKLFKRAAMISVDYFRNDFTDQVIVDLEDPRRVRFYNLDGKSYSNSLQAEISLIPIKALEMKMAYRWFDVKATYDDKLLQRPFTARHRAFVNLGYEYSGWKFDYTVNYTGEKRIPSTMANPEMHRMAERSPDYFTMNAQVSKMVHKKTGLELYLGAENLTGYMQKHAILAADEPFGPHFDASMIWGPLTERMFYGGFRMRLK